MANSIEVARKLKAKGAAFVNRYRQDIESLAVLLRVHQDLDPDTALAQALYFYQEYDKFQQEL